MIDKLGAIPLAPDILNKSNIGLWAFELDEGCVPRMYVDDTMLGLLGLTEQISPEETYHAWYDNIDSNSYQLVTEAVNKMISGEHAEVQYPWHSPDGHSVIVRGGGVRNYAYTKGVRIEGVHQNVSAVVHFDIDQYKKIESIVNGFINEYDAVFLVNINNDSNYRVLSDYDKLSNILDKVSSFSEAMQLIGAVLIHPADREVFLECFADFKQIKKKLASQKLFSCEHRIKVLGNYEWHRGTINIIGESEIIIGFKDCNEEVTKRIQQFDLLEAIAGDYRSLYYIDIATGNIIPYLMREETKIKMSEIFETTMLYKEAFKSYVKHFVYNLDRRRVLEAGKTENVLKKLAHNKTYAVTYRSLQEGDIVFCEMRFFRANDERGRIKGVALAFAYKDEEIMGRYINEKLIGEYISAFIVDLKQDKYRIYRKPDLTLAMNRVDHVWSKAVGDFATECDPEYYNIVKNIGSPEFLRNELMNVDRREYLYRFPSADKPWRRAIIQVVDRTDGIPVTVIATFMGIDAYQSKLEDQKKKLAEQQAELEMAKSLSDAASAAKTTFLFNMSHDIRTPMNAIKGFTAMAKKYINDKERVGDCLEKIDTAGKTLLQLINQVLDMSKIESGKVVLAEEPADVVERAYEMISIINSSAVANGITASCVVKSVSDRNVFADVGRVNQIILNILGNAVKYTPNGGLITYTVEQIKCDRQGYGTYVFTIEDTGSGMSKKFINKLFEPFSREKTSTVSRIEGTGLGMSIVKHLVDLMGGTIEVESEIGKGTKIAITLTFRLQENSGSNLKDEQEYNLDVLKGKRILLVEDNDMNREIAREILLDRGLLVDEAEDGDIAVEKLQAIADRGEYDYYAAVLMDIQMPRMDGYTATRKIRAIPAPPGVRMPIIAMTANAFEEDKKNAFAAGMDAHIAKPIDVEKFWDTLIKFV